MFNPEDLEKLEQIPGAIEEAAREAVKELGLLGQEEMVHILSGGSVSHSGGVFQVGVVTGNLRRQVRMEYPFAGSEYESAVLNRAPYANIIENGISGEQKKRMILTGGKAAKYNKDGRAYKRIPMGKGQFWTVTEDSQLKDQKARPFAQATAERLENNAESIMEQAIEEVLKERLG